MTRSQPVGGLSATGHSSYSRPAGAGHAPVAGRSSPSSRTPGRGLMSSRTNNPDVVVVGGGIAGASIATVLARGGVQVLIVERQCRYRDRVRGEYLATWGVLEARALGLEDMIRGTHAADARYMVPYDELCDPSAAEAARSDRSTVF